MAYFIAAVLLLIFFAIEYNLFDAFYDFATETIFTGLLVSFLTMIPPSWLGDFYGLAILVPWFGSTLVLVLLLSLFDGGAKRRWVLGGVSLGVYYLAMFIANVTGCFNGDGSYLPLLIWPAVGFGLGYLAAFIVDKIMKPEFDV